MHQKFKILSLNVFFSLSSAFSFLFQIWFWMRYSYVTNTFIHWHKRLNFSHLYFINHKTVCLWDTIEYNWISAFNVTAVKLLYGEFVTCDFLVTHFSATVLNKVLMFHVLILISKFFHFCFYTVIRFFHDPKLACC